MQVVGLRRLKYSIISGDDYTEQCTSRYDFQFQSDRPIGNRSSIRYTDDEKYWEDETPYRFLLSDGINAIVGKFYTESSTGRSRKREKADAEMHSSAIHRLVIAGQLKEGSIISFVPNNHKYSGKGIVTMFRMKVEGWQEIIGNPVPSHEGVVSYSPIGIHQCTVSINKESSQRPINSAAIQLAKIIKDFCGYCTISGSAVLAEYLHDLPGCEHCYEKHYNTFLRDVCGRGGFNNDIDIFVPDLADNLTRFYETGDRERVSNRFEGFDESTLESHIFPALYKQYGIRHTSVICTDIRLSRLGQEDSIDPYDPLDHNDEGTNQTTMDYGCE